MNIKKRIKHEKNIVYVLSLGIVIIWAGIVWGHYIPQSTRATENLKQYKILQKMSEIDDIGHEQDKILHSMGNGYNIQRDKTFHVVDNAYHIAEKRSDKFIQAGQLNLLIKEQNTFIYQLIDAANPFSELAKEKFDKLQDEISQLESK